MGWKAVKALIARTAPYPISCDNLFAAILIAHTMRNYTQLQSNYQAEEILCPSLWDALLWEEVLLDEGQRFDVALLGAEDGVQGGHAARELLSKVDYSASRIL